MFKLLNACVLLFFLQSDKFYRNASLLDSGQVQQTAAILANATLHTEKFYGSDVKVAYRLTQSLLQHESNQQGFNLTATQDVHFTEVNSHIRTVYLHRRIHNTTWNKVQTRDCCSFSSKQNGLHAGSQSCLAGIHAVSAGSTLHFISLSAVASCHIELSLFSHRIWSVWAAPSCLQTHACTGSWSSTRKVARRRCCDTTRITQTQWHRTWGRPTWAPSPSSHHT